MSESDSPRRVTAEIRFGVDQSTIAKIGNRSIYQYWQLLARDFQGILLAPQRRPDEGGVAWNWREPAGSGPLTAAELAGVRERLTNANQSFAKSMAGAELGAEGLGGLSAEEGARQLGVRVNEIVTKLTGKTDAKLAAYACRTETGLMIHSWGASAPAQPRYPDARNCEVSGTVIVGDKGAADFEVVIESRAGVVLARARSDASGSFRLEKIGPGTHRVRVVSSRVDFPVSGVMVTVEHASITNLELRSTSLTISTEMTSTNRLPAAAVEATQAAADSSAAAATVERAPVRRRWRWAAAIAAAAVLMAGGSWWALRWWNSEDPKPVLTADRPSLTTGRFSGKITGGIPSSSSHMPNLGRIGSRSAGPTPGSESRTAPSGSGSAGPSALPMASNAAGAARMDGEKDRPIEGAPGTDGSPGPDNRNRTELLRDAPEKPVADNNSADNMPQLAAEPDATKPEELDKVVDAILPQRIRKPAKPPRPGRAEAGGASPAENAANPRATPPKGDEDVGAESPANRPVVSRPAPGGAKAGNAVPETRADSAKPPAGESGAAEDMPGADGAEKAGLGQPGTPLASPVRAAGGTAGRPSTPVAPKSGPVSAKAEGELADQASASEPGKSAFGAFAEAGGEKPGTKAAGTSAHAPLPAGSTSLAEAPETATEPAWQAAPPGQTAGDRKVVSRAHKSVRAQPGPPNAALDVAPANATDPAVPPPVRPEARTGQSVPAAAAHVDHVPHGNTPGRTSETDRDPGSVETPAGSAVTQSPAPEPTRAAEVPVDSDRLTRQLHIRVSPWRPQLVSDAILPTQPVRVGEDDAIESLRERYLLERRNQMPESFKNPVLWSGFSVEIPGGDASAGEPLRWREATTGQGNQATVSGGRAEIEWSGGIPPARADYVLCEAGDRVVASLSVRSGEVVLKAVARVRAWYWVAVEPAAADAASLPPERAAARFHWQLGKGAAMPDSIRRDEHWRSGRARRCDLPLDLREGAGRRSEALAFVDRVTGWAIGGEIEQTQ